MEKVEKLLTARFIQEVYFPKRLANVVMLKSPTKSGECVWTSPT